MSVDIGYNIRKPQDGDKDFWSNLEALFDAFVSHTHDTVNSPGISTANITKPSSTLAAQDWLALTGEGYTQSVTVPAGVSLDKVEPVFFIASGPNQYKRVHPTVDVSSLTVMNVIVNDNSLELKVIYV